MGDEEPSLKRLRRNSEESEMSSPSQEAAPVVLPYAENVDMFLQHPKLYKPLPYFLNGPYQNVRIFHICFS